VKVPWFNLLSAPLEITIGQVFALLEPKAESEWDVESAQMFYKETVNKALEQFELLNVTEFDAPKLGMGERMVAKILDNLQVNIH
jgi:hypothetical protein